MFLHKNFLAEKFSKPLKLWHEYKIKVIGRVWFQAFRAKIRPFWHVFFAAGFHIPTLMRLIREFLISDFSYLRKFLEDMKENFKFENEPLIFIFESVALIL